MAVFWGPPCRLNVVNFATDIFVRTARAHPAQLGGSLAMRFISRHIDIDIDIDIAIAIDSDLQIVCVDVCVWR